MKWLARSFVLVWLVLSVSNARAEIHALIMTISQYQGGIPALKGVAYDAENAKAIAQKMGVKNENIRFLKDGQLTLAGMRAAFDELQSSLHPGDQVFVYYSGHGGRQYVRDANTERCAESLITDDAQGFIDSELEERLKRLGQTAQKVVVFLDACHSGGATTRSISGAFAAKYWSKGEADACAKPVNVLTRGLSVAAQSPGSGAQNYVYIAAARDNEISLDQPGRGGVATTAWLSCISGGAKDADSSGGLTAEEIRVCAQDRIDATLKGAVGYAPHHISITGNPGMVMKLTDAADVAAGAGDHPAKPAASVDPVGRPSALAAMRDIYNGRDDTRTVSLASNKSALKVNKDYVDLTLTSTRPGYVYLLMAGSDGRAFDMIFPNKIDGENHVKAGQVIHLPRTGWQLMAQGPVGEDHLLAIVTDVPRDFSQVGMVPSGPFSTVEASYASTRGIQSVTNASAGADSACGQDAANVKCSAAYGAALITVKEGE